MARPKSEFLKALGVMWEIWQALVNEVLALGGDDNSLRRILTNAKLRRELALLIVNKAKEMWKSLTSTGVTGETWITHLEGKGFRVDDYAKQILRSEAFTSTTGTVYDLVVIKGEEFPTDAERTNEKVRAEAKRRGYLTPPAEVAPMLRESISDKEIEKMGLYALIVMHEPVAGADDDLYLLGVNRYGGGQWLLSYLGFPQRQWIRARGFVFLAPRT